MDAVTCRRCGICVLVKKNSPAHTLVQWTTATDGCAELAERALTPSCTQLHASIDAAVHRGELVVANP